MAMTETRAYPKWQSITLWGVKILVALAFVAAGSLKLYGIPMMVDEFDHIGFGQWFRYATGLLEISGAILLLVPSAAIIGAGLLSCVMVGAIITHLFVIGGSPIPAVVLLALNLIVAYAERHRLRIWLS